MINYKVFPTPIGEFKDVLFQEQCDEIISHVEKTCLKQYGALIGDSQTSFNTQVSIVNTLPKELSLLLTMKIQNCLNQYTNETGIAKLVLENTWVSFQYPHSKLKNHTHPGSEVSGVLYLRVDEKSSPIYFYNPNPFSTFTTLTNENREYFCKSVKFKPTTGTILLFPSWLSHGSGDDENMSEERIILSFNTKSSGVSV